MTTVVLPPPRRVSWPAALFALVAICALEYVRRRGTPEFHPADLDPEMLYEECPECEGEADGCLNCLDAGVVPHDCPEEYEA